MELILLFIIYVIIMALKDIRTPHGKFFDVGKYCQYVQKYGQEEADKAKKEVCLILINVWGLRVQNMI